jgi:hypothetical protein
MDTSEEKEDRINIELSTEDITRDQQLVEEKEEIPLTQEEEEAQKTMQAFDELLEIKEKVFMKIIHEYVC